MKVCGLPSLTSVGLAVWRRVGLLVMSVMLVCAIMNPSICRYLSSSVLYIHLSVLYPSVLFMSLCSSVHPSVESRSLHPSVHLYIHLPFLCPSVHLYIHLSSPNLYIHLSIITSILHLPKLPSGSPLPLLYWAKR